MLRFCENKILFILGLEQLPEWLHQKLEVQLQEKQRAREKEMRQQKLQQDKLRRQELDVVQLQKEVHLHEERHLHEDGHLHEERQLHEERHLHEDEQLHEERHPHEEPQEGDVSLFFFFILKFDTNCSQSFLHNDVSLNKSKCSFFIVYHYPCVNDNQLLWLFKEYFDHIGVSFVHMCTILALAILNIGRLETFSDE